MLRYLTAAQLQTETLLQQTMFRDRARQFRDRLGWEVSVDANGWERDTYDAADPLYVIWQMPDGTHGGSMRFLPTMGPTMFDDHFRHLNDGLRVSAPGIWECTRFCLAPDAPTNVAAALMLGGSEVGRNFSLTHALGVFDQHMIRVYRRLGWGPTILGSRDGISAGLWQFSAEIHRQMCVKAGVLPATSAWWFDLSHNRVTAPRRASA